MTRCFHIIAFLAGIVFVGGMTSGNEGLHRFEFRQMHMGVEARIVLYAPHENIARTAADAAFERIAQLEDILSDYRPHSEVMRLSAASGGDPVTVSEDLFFVLRRSQEMAAATDGAFDATVGPVVQLWRSARRTGRLPEPEALQDAQSRVGWQHVVLDEHNRTARLGQRGMQLDFGGIAKGYACDEALRVLAGHGIERAMVEMGGDVVVSGPPPNRDAWRIRIANAPPDENDLALSHAAVSTSGDTEQFVEIDNTRYSHIVDPQTGLGLTHRLAVTIIAEDGITSDAFATAVSVLGYRKGSRFLEAHPAVKGFIVRAAE